MFPLCNFLFFLYLETTDFTTADYYWPFHEDSTDSRQGLAAQLQDGAKIQHHVAMTTHGGQTRGWIDLGDFAGMSLEALTSYENTEVSFGCFNCYLSLRGLF